MDIQATVTKADLTTPELAFSPDRSPAHRDSTFAFSIEWGRLLAAAAVIWIHVFKSSQLQLFGDFAVPVFTFIAFYLLSQSLLNKPNRPAIPYLRGRAQHILGPFVVWSILFYLAYAAVDYFARRPLPRYAPSVLLRGTAYHLWYLPFLFFATILLFPFIRILAHKSAQTRTRIGIAAIGASILLFFFLPNPPDAGGGPYGLYRWADSFPSAIAGAACAAIGLRERLNTPFLTSLVLFLTFAVLGVSMCEIQRTPLIASNFAGLALGVAMLAIPNMRWMAPVARLGKYSLGIYLIHIAFLEILQAALPAASPPVTLPAGILLTMAVFTLSCVTVLLGSRVAALKWLFGL